MFGFVKKYTRAALLGLVFFAASLTLASIANPGHAAAAGTIHGGKYYFEVTINNEANKFFIDNETTTITLEPETSEADKKIKNEGFVDITNVPAGTYTVTLNFKLTRGVCENNGWRGKVAARLPGTNIICALRGDVYYSGSRVFGPVKVEDGKTTNLETDTTGEKKAANAIRTDSDGNPKLTCSGGYLTEWVICPIIENIFATIDFGMNHIIKPFLVVAPLQATDADGKDTPLYTIWDNLRNFVNIGFIIVFFVIIFSQATSVGISNYGIKKLLPRLIAIAIATNLSFYICAFLIDIFNILGAGISSLLTTAVLNGAPTVDLSGGILINTAIIAALPLLLMAAPVAIPAVFIFIVVGFVLFLIVAFVVLLRQVILIFLIIVSPLAFLAAILPNTSRYASQWFTMFIRLLLLYPLIMLAFAIGKIASSVLSQVGGIGG